MGKTTPEIAPDWDYYTSQKMHYYGYKMHAVCGLNGVIHSYDRVHDIHYLKDVQQQFSVCLILGYKSYLSAKIQLDHFQ